MGAHLAQNNQKLSDPRQNPV